MNKRPKPTRLLIQELTGDDRTLVESLHHGLDECTSLSTIYINLDLDELVAFAASTRKGREKGDYDPSMNLHEAFGHAYRRTPGREVRVMNFQNYYPKSGRIVPAFINEISKVIGTYPREYNLPQVSTQSGKPEHIARTVKKQLDKLRGGRPM